MRARFTPLAVALLLVAGAASGAQAQTLSVTAKVGGYLPLSDAYAIPDAVGHTLTVDRAADMSIGGAAELDLPILPLNVRVGADYLTAAELSTAGVSGDVVVGEGSLLMLSGDLVARILPRILTIQPYVLGGVGYKKETYTPEDGVDAALPEDYSDYMLHAGVGADLMLGRIGIVAEVSDYFGSSDGAGITEHNVFATVGLRLGLF